MVHLAEICSQDQLSIISYNINKMQLKISGVYDSETIKKIISLGIRHISFDMRPTSMNFIQLYKIKELIDLHGHQFDSFGLHLNNEKDFIIHNAIKDLSELDLFSKIILEFDDLLDVNFYEQFNVPFIWNYHRMVKIENIIKSKNLTSIKFDENIIRSLEINGDTFDVFKNIFELKKNYLFSIELAHSWNGEFSSSIFDFFNFDTLSFAINHNVENHYRNVNLDLFEKNLLIYKNQYLKQDIR